MNDYSGYYSGYVSSIVIKNNSFCNTGGGLCLWYNSNGYHAAIDYNNYYFTGSNMN